MNEIRVENQVGSITANFDELEAYLQEQLGVYKGLQFTEADKKLAKETVAELRKKKKDLGDRAKEVKKEYMIPLDNFMAQVKKLDHLFDEPIDLINDQINEFEQKRIAEKKTLITEIYAELIPEEDLSEIIPLTNIYSLKWENATTTEKQIRAEIMEIKINAKNAIEAIKNFHSDMESQALAMYSAKRDLGECMAYLTNYENQKKAILEAEQKKLREEEEARIRAEERAKIEAEQREAEKLSSAIEEAKNEAISEAVEAYIPTDDEAQAENITYIIQLTPDAKQKLEMFMDSVGILYEEMVF